MMPPRQTKSRANKVSTRSVSVRDNISPPTRRLRAKSTNNSRKDISLFGDSNNGKTGKSVKHNKNGNSKNTSKVNLDQTKTKIENTENDDSNLITKIVKSNKCSICNMVFSNEDQLVDHEVEIHEVNKPSCPTCHKNFTRKSHLERHLKTSCVTASTKFKCTECNKCFTRQDNLKLHIKKHFVEETNREKKYQCETCFKMFYTPSHLQIHTRIHTGERPYKCDYCTKTFTNNGALKKHVRIHTGEKPFQCKMCDISFSLKGTLNRHMKTHTGVKPHKCEFCGKEFIQSGGLKAHLFFHTGKNGFKCDQCDRQFNRKARLDMHKKYVHEKVKPFACTVCEKTFTRKEDLNRHVILHTGEKSHHCLYCNKSFAIKASLNVHMLTHRREDPRACQQCGHAFIRKDCLARHIRKVHREQADVLLFQHDLIDKDISIVIDNESLGEIDVESDLVNGKLNDDKLCEAIRELLNYVVDPKLLKSFGWPNTPVDSLLESLIKQCNYDPVRPEDYNYYDRLRENVKLLFTVVIEDDSLKETLNNKTVDELIVTVIMEAKDFNQ